MELLLAVLVFALAALVMIVGGRALLLRGEAPRHHHEPFDGTAYRVGDAVIAARRVENPSHTVIAMHGFIEDMRYFAQLYRDPSIQLIVLTSCGYHLPITDAVFETPPWAKAPDAPFGTIAYDAAVMLLALEHLPKARAVRVHGHSRGGAVTLEAARARPELFKDVEVVLEAPVLPHAKTYKKLSALARWLVPFFIPSWRKDPLSKRVVRIYGPLEDARKRELMAGMPHNPKRISTFLANMDDMMAWMRDRDPSLYANVRRGAVLVPSRDRVLDASAMRASAEHAKPQLELVLLEGCSHFITLDRPDAIPALTPAAPAGPSSP